MREKCAEFKERVKNGELTKVEENQQKVNLLQINAYPN